MAKVFVTTMCITPNPAELEGTCLAGFVKGNRHTVFYGIDSFSSAEANALCFTVPTDEEFGKENFIDVGDAPSLTQKLQEAYVAAKSAGSRGGFSKGLSVGLEIFDVGNWIVAVASSGSAEEILQALAEIPSDCRPDIPKDVLETFLRIGNPVVMACLKPSAGEHGMEDLVYSYVPRDTTNLILPALDGHGTAPRKQAVLRDHYVFAGTEDTVARYSIPVGGLIKKVPALDSLLPYREVEGQKIVFFDGRRVSGYFDNGDLLLPIAPLAVEGSNRPLDFLWPEALSA